MSRPGTRALATRLSLAAGLALTGCTPPDGAGPLPPPPPKAAAGDRISVVVDTDLGADDLVALAFLLRHPDVDVRALTIPATGLVDCGPGLDVAAGLFAALAAEPVPIACGRATAGPGGRPFPPAWRTAAADGWGLTPEDGAPGAEPEDAVDLLAGHARDTSGLVVVALGPMTNVAELATRHPDDFQRLGAVHAMAGSVSGPLVDGVAEWNAAADPAALGTVLTGPVPVTVVPEDAVPEGTPEILRGPVVGRVAQAADLPAWWDLAAVAALVTPDAGPTEDGGWELHGSEPGRLGRQGDGVGDVRVYRALDPQMLESEYARVFSTR